MTRRSSPMDLAVAGLASFFWAACGDHAGVGDAGPVLNCEDFGGEACFELPADPGGTVAMAYDSATMTLVAADWNCAEDMAVTAAGPVTLSGIIADSQSGDPVDNAELDVFTGLDYAAPAASAISAGDGTYSITMASGARSLMNFRTSKPDTAFDVYELFVPVDIVNGETNFTRISVSPLWLRPPFGCEYGCGRTEGLGLLAGVARDCQEREVANVIATVSSTSSAGDAGPTFVPRAVVNYFQGQDADPNLPTRRRVTMTENFKKTQDDGRFLIKEIPPTATGATYFMQVWGFKNAADVAWGTAGLSLLSELEAPVIGDTVIVVDMRPTEGP